MSKANEPAFPVVERLTGVSLSNGLSIRTYLAGQAMIGLLSTHEQLEQYSINGGNLDVERIATDSVKAADALIAALNKTPQP